MEDGSETARRKAIVDKVQARAARLGVTIDPDPIVGNLFDSWVNGDHTLKEIRARYLEHLVQREQAKSEWRMLSIDANLARLRR